MDLLIFVPRGCASDCRINPPQSSSFGDSDDDSAGPHTSLDAMDKYISEFSSLNKLDDDASPTAPKLKGSIVYREDWGKKSQSTIGTDLYRRSDRAAHGLGLAVLVVFRETRQGAQSAVWP